MARESEIPLEECANARLPFPPEDLEDKGRPATRIPEGAPGDNWIDDTFWLQEEPEPQSEPVVRRVSPRRKK